MTLADRLPRLPLVLAGPVLRRVEPSSTTVWLALKEPRTVSLRVHRADDLRGEPVQEGSRATVRIGRSLHLVAVTARGDHLAWGTQYLYDLSFAAVGPGGGAEQGLFDRGVLSMVGSGRDVLLYPTPGAPPLPSFATAPEDLNDLRILHGSCRRPSGAGPDLLAAVDGIVGATVGEPARRPHHLLLTGDQIYADDVADVHLEMLIDLADALLGWEEVLPGVGVSGRALPPGTRGEAGRRFAGLPQEAGKMKSQLLTLGEFVGMYLTAWSDVPWPRELPGPPQASAEWRNLETYRAGLRRVRRALANVPTSMMMDDHEITDGFFISLHWCRETLGRPLGRRLVQNGLTAFALCEAWGNTPDRFEDGPGRALLEAVADWDGSEGSDAVERIAVAVGVPEVHEADRRLVRPEPSLRWHYSVPGPRHRVVVLDTRTGRDYPDLDSESPALLDADELRRQIGDELEARSPGEEVLILVSPPPLINVPFATAEKRDLGLFEADRELWEYHGEALERLLAALVRRREHVVVLSGDVHCAFALRLALWAGSLFGYPGEAGRGVIAQLVASPLKNETPAKRRFHQGGYDLVRGDLLAAPWDRAGWHLPEGGHRVETVGGARFDREADWRYRVDFLAAGGGGAVPPDTDRDPSGEGNEIVGVNNLGELTFRWTPSSGRPEAVHAAWWVPEGGDEPLARTTWVVPLSIDDDRFPQPAPLLEGGGGREEPAGG